MKSSIDGENISQVEVLNISKDGLWILIDKGEYFLDFENFPWFKNANLSAIFDVQSPHPNHLFWRSLDIDLELDSIKSPQEYPLIYKEQL